MKNKFLFGLMAILTTFALAACGQPASTPTQTNTATNPAPVVTSEPAAKTEVTSTVVVEDNLSSILMQEGKVKIVKMDGSADLITKDTVLKDGTEVSTEGKVLRPDGRIFFLPDGISIKMDGTMYPNDYLKVDEKTVKGFTMKGGKMMMVMMDGTMSAMDVSIKLKSGSVMETNGDFYTDGSSEPVKEGMMVMMDGTKK